MEAFTLKLNKENTFSSITAICIGVFNVLYVLKELFCFIYNDIKGKGALRQNIIVQPKSYSISNLYIKDLFLDYNRSGRITGALIGVILIFLVVYLTFLFVETNTNLITQKNNYTVSKLQEEAILVELKLQNSTALLAKNNNNIVESMVKVSGIKYITPVNIVFSGHPNRP